MDILDLTQENLEKIILKDMGDEFAKHVDEEMAYYLQFKYWESQGWTKIDIPKFQDNEHAVDITYWLDENHYVDRVNYYREGREFIFRDPEMAMVFALRWA